MKRVLSCALILCLTTGALAATEPASLPEAPPAEDDSVQKSVDEVQGPAAIQLDEGTQIILPDSRAVRLKESWWLLNRPGTEKCASWSDQAKQLSAEVKVLQQQCLGEQPKPSFWRSTGVKWTVRGVVVSGSFLTGAIFAKLLSDKR